MKERSVLMDGALFWFHIAFSAERRPICCSAAVSAKRKNRAAPWEAPMRGAKKPRADTGINRTVQKAALALIWQRDP